MDSALRRRFDFIDMPPRPEVLVDNPKLQRFLEVLNRRLEKVKPGSGCQVGHAWLSQDGVAFPCSHAKLLCGAFNNKVFPLLSEWFWNEPAQLRALMGGAFKYVDARTGIIERLDEKLLDPKKPGSAEHFLDFFVLDDDDSES
jgi:5-methylcytosine-specific restriction protein B